MCCKNKLFTDVGTLLITVSTLNFLFAMGSISMTFCALQTGLKFDDFLCLPGELKAEALRPAVGNCIGSWSWSPFQQPSSLQELIQDREYSIRHAGIMGYENDWIQHGQKYRKQDTA